MKFLSTAHFLQSSCKLQNRLILCQHLPLLFCKTALQNRSIFSQHLDFSFPQNVLNTRKNFKNNFEGPCELGEKIFSAPLALVVALFHFKKKSESNSIARIFSSITFVPFIFIHTSMLSGLGWHHLMPRQEGGGPSGQPPLPHAFRGHEPHLRPPFRGGRSLWEQRPFPPPGMRGVLSHRSDARLLRPFPR